MPSPLTDVMLCVLDQTTIKGPIGITYAAEWFALKIGEELRDHDVMMVALAQTIAETSRGPHAVANEADERLVLDLLDVLTSDGAGS